MSNEINNDLRKEGICRWFDSSKGYGFICDENNKDYFVHYSDIEDSGLYKNLEEGEKVSFKIAMSDKGEKCVNVRKL